MEQTVVRVITHHVRRRVVMCAAHMVHISGAAEASSPDSLPHYLCQVRLPLPTVSLWQQTPQTISSSSYPSCIITSAVLIRAEAV